MLKNYGGIEWLTLDLGPGTSVFIEGASYSKSTSDFVAVLLTYLQPRRGEGKGSNHYKYWARCMLWVGQNRMFTLSTVWVAQSKHVSVSTRSLITLCKSTQK